jgi:hypothetical protein
MTVHTLGRRALLLCQTPLSGGPDPEVLLSQMEKDGTREVLLDATQSPWADSDGLRWLLALQRTLETKGRSLTVVARAEGRVWRNVVLLQAGLALYPSVRAAWHH